MQTSTTPLAKAITTLEGQVVVVAGVILTVGSSIDPSKLPPSLSAVLGSVLGLALLVQRYALKAKASPGLNAIIDAPSAGNAGDQILTMLEQLEQAQAAFQAKPGTPADQIAAGLAPSTLPVVAP